MLQENGTLEGEGFAILAIQCTLIEFLESTVLGITYRHLRKGERLSSHEYTKSGELFVNFLTKRAPFQVEFDEALAEDFYTNVRCGLLHEAQTKNGWRVWAKGPKGASINRSQRKIYRDGFQEKLIEFVESYGTTLRTTSLLQESFIRKFDSLCL